MFLEYFNLSRMGLGNWEEPVLWMMRPGPSLLIIGGVILFLFFTSARLRGFWGIVVYLISGGVILICLKNLVRL